MPNDGQYKDTEWWAASANDGKLWRTMFGHLNADAPDLLRNSKSRAPRKGAGGYQGNENSQKYKGEN